MIDLYLKADSEQELTSALMAVGFSVDEESGALYHPDAALDVIGTIYQPTGKTALVDGQEVPVTAPVPGHHVNVRTTSETLATSLESFRTYPETPVRAWC